MMAGHDITFARLTMVRDGADFFDVAVHRNGEWIGNLRKDSHSTTAPWFSDARLSKEGADVLCENLSDAKDYVRQRLSVNLTIDAIKSLASAMAAGQLRGTDLGNVVLYAPMVAESLELPEGLDVWDAGEQNLITTQVILKALKTRRKG